MRSFSLSRSRCRVVSICALALCLSCWLAAGKVAADPLDWTRWRGPEQNGISRETGLPAKFDPEGGEGSNVVWRRAELGTRSTPIVMNGHLYIMARSDVGTKKEGERVICAKAVTGEIVWQKRFNVFLSDVPAERVGWSCVAGDPQTGLVYAQGVCGHFFCLDGKTGEVKWERSLSEEFGLLSTYGGRTNVPTLFEDLVITSSIIIGWGDMAKPVHGLIAFDKLNGQVRWFRGTRPLPYDTTYSTPTITAIGGQAMMIFGSGDGAVWAMQPRTGKRIWNYRFSRRGLNVSPLVVGDRVFTGHSEENVTGTAMGSLVSIKAGETGDITKSGALWKKERVMVGKSSPLVVDGRLYACEDKGKLLIYDVETGKRIGKNARERTRGVTLAGTSVRASPIYADGKIYVCSTSAWHVFLPTKTGVKMVTRQRMPSGEAIHGSPIVSHGRIYLPTTAAMYCIALPDVKPQSDPIPPAAKEQLQPNAPATQLQIVPAELMLAPGEKAQFKVRLFNAVGQFIKESTADFSLAGTGEVDKQGTFTAASGNKPTATIVTAKVGDLAGQARVRTIPLLPWKFDFEDVALTKNPKTGVMEGEPPLAWVGIRYRHKVRKVDGSNVLVKVDYIPKGTRSQGWMGMPNVKDYTIQADVCATIKDDKIPDIGLIAQRYTLDLMGQSQQIQIRTWTPQLRMAKTVPFQWQPKVWYTLKLRAEAAGDKAILKGKVWERGAKEPGNWMVEAIDNSPNLQGSPGLFGNATFSELYLDNITVTPNK